jgi:hypothetical protein
MARVTGDALAVALMCIGLATTSAVRADEKTDVTGTWAFEVDLGGNQGTPTFTFKQAGEKLTGKYNGQLGEADVTGSVKGNLIKFSFEVEGGRKVVYTGTIEKDSMKGKADYGEVGSGTWTAKRKKAD